MNVCGNDADPFLRVNGVPPRPGVLGAVAIPDCRREGLSGNVKSEVAGGKEDIRGEGCVDDRWPIGAVHH